MFYRFIRIAQSLIAPGAVVVGLAGAAYGSPSTGSSRSEAKTAVTVPVVVQPGPQEQPPGPSAPEAPALDTDPSQRRAIRGCPVSSDCRGPDLSGLREFELATFGPRRSSSPWLSDDDALGRSVTRVGRHGDGSGRFVSPRKGTDVRPDLPWLDELELPDLPIYWDERLIEYLLFYKDDPRGRNIMRAWLRDQSKYRDMILQELRRARLPEDLLYVAMIESSYNPHEYSRVGASGLWQFMPAAGRIYGLTINRWIDERNDPVRSTEAVVLYFADLYQRFGDWHLAMAAFNSGYGAVLKAVATYNSNNFWELSRYENALTFGAVLYVPKALAAAIIGRNRKFFGFDDIAEAQPITWDTVTVHKSVALSVVARAVGATVEELEVLNPQLRRGRTPPSMKDYVLRIPQGKAELFAERFPQLRSEWDNYDAYVVSHGERFEDIATLHGMSRRKLASLNGISHESEVQGGTVLVVPRVSEEEKERNRQKAQASLYNSGEPEGEDGEALVVALPDKDLQIKGKQRVFYRVVIGDTQYGVAKAFGVSVQDLAAWNSLEPDAHLHPRMVLQVFVAPDFRAEDAGVALLDAERLLIVTRGSEEHLNLVESRRGRERVVYRAEKRESFEEIGRKFGLTERDLARINLRPHNTVLQPGEEIVVYRVVDRKRLERADSRDEDEPETKRKRVAERKESDEAQERKESDEAQERKESDEAQEKPKAARERKAKDSEQDKSKAAAKDSEQDKPKAAAKDSEQDKPKAARERKAKDSKQDKPRARAARGRASADSKAAP